MTPFDFPTLSKELYSAVLSDVMDDLGLTQQAMRPFIRPVDDTLVLMGRVRTGLFVDTYSVRAGENPYEFEIALLDDLKPQEVPVLLLQRSDQSHCSVGRAADDGVQSARSGRMCDGRFGQGPASNQKARIPGISRRHRSSGYQGTGSDD